MQLYEAIAKELADCEIKAGFTFLSDDIAPLVAECRRAGITMYTTRHEHVAVGMADGYSRSSGSTGLALVGRGPGLTNAVNALVTARKAKSSILVIAGHEQLAQNAESVPQGIGKYIDQETFESALGLARITILNPATCIPEIQLAVTQAAGGSTTVVNLPARVGWAQIEGWQRSHSILERKPIQPDPIEIDRVAELLCQANTAKRVLVLAGRGVIKANAHRALIDLAQKTGALLATTLPAQSLFASQPYNIGIIGTFGSPIAAELAASADVVLAFGTSLSEFTTLSAKAFGHAALVQVDIDSEALAREYPGKTGVLGDARLAADAISAALAGCREDEVGYRTDEIATKIASFHIRDTFRDRSRNGSLDVRSVMLALNEVLPRDRALVFDGGNQALTSIRYLSPISPGFEWATEYFAIGCGLGIALGSAVARPDRWTVLVIGDGGLMMTLSDLDTASRYRLPIVIIVNNDSALATEVQFLRDHGFDDSLARYVNPSFVELARALGADGICVRSLDDVQGIGKRLLTMDGPVLVECQVNVDVYPDVGRTQLFSN